MSTFTRRFIIFLLVLLGANAHADGPVYYLTPFSKGLVGTNFTLLQWQTALGIAGGSNSVVLIAGSNITITTNSANNFTIASSGGGGTTNNFIAYTNVSQAFSGVQVITNNGSTISANKMTNTALQASSAMVTDAGDGFASSSTTATELAFVHGVTSAIQTQINAISTSLTTGSLLVTGAATVQGNFLPEIAGPSAILYTDSGTNTIGLPYSSGDNGSMLRITGGVPSLGKDASALTSLNASQLTSGTVPDNALAGASPTFNVATITNGLTLTGTNANQGGKMTLTSSNAQYIVTLITGLTNALNLIVSNLNGSYFWVTTNGNVHTSNSLNTSSSAITNGGAWFSGRSQVGASIIETGSSGDVAATTFTGSGVNLTALNGTQVTSGTVPVARLPVATSSTLGVVKPDNSTITIDGSGVISSVGGGGGSTNTMLTVVTNWIDGQLYTNLTGSAIFVSASAWYFTPIVAATGKAMEEIWVAGTRTNDNGVATTVSVTLTTAETNLFGIEVPNGSTFVFTNVSSGTGNAAGIVGGQYAYATNIVGLGYIGTGTSGGIPYYSASTTVASSAALTANGVVVGGGPGTAPRSTAVGTAGQVLTSNGAGVDPTFQAATGSSKSSCIIGWGSETAITMNTSGSARYQAIGIASSAAGSAITASHSAVPYAGYITNIWVNNDTGFGAGTNVTLTIFTNGVAANGANQQISWSGAGTSTAVQVSNLVGSIIIPAGCYLHINYSNNSGSSPAAQLFNGHFEYVKNP